MPQTECFQRQALTAVLEASLTLFFPLSLSLTLFLSLSADVALGQLGDVLALYAQVCVPSVLFKVYLMLHWEKEAFLSHLVQ